MDYFTTLLHILECVINIEEEFENRKVPYSIRDVFERAERILDRVQDPFWGFDELPEEDQKAFHQLFDELMERPSVCEHDLAGRHRRH